MTLTEKQAELADLLWNTETVAPVRRRKALPGGGYEFYKTERATRPIDFPVNDEEFVLKMHDTKPDALLSPIYINLRNLPDDVLTKVAETIAEATEGFPADFCAGIPAAGTPIVQAYANIPNTPTLVEVFSKAEAGATDRQILAAKNALHGQGRSLRIVDDLITGADTKFEAANVAKTLGWQVADFAVLFDREQGGSEQLTREGYTVRAALRLNPTLNYYRDTGRLSAARYDQIQAYLASARR